MKHKNRKARKTRKHRKVGKYRRRHNRQRRVVRKERKLKLLQKQFSKVNTKYARCAAKFQDLTKQATKLAYKIAKAETRLHFGR